MDEQSPDRMLGIEQRQEAVRFAHKTGANKEHQANIDSIIFWDSIVAGVSYFEKFRVSRRLAKTVVEYAEERSANAHERMLDD